MIMTGLNLQSRKFFNGGNEYMILNNKAAILFILIILIFLSCSIEDTGDDDSNGIINIDQPDGMVIFTGMPCQFSAVVQNSTDSELIWSVTSADVMDSGSISNGGLYMPPHEDVISSDFVNVTVTASLAGNTSVLDSLDFTVERRFHLAYDINIGGDSNPYYFEVYMDKLYFSANVGNGQELWCYDGTNPPYEVADINTGGDSNPSGLTVYNGKLYFSANNGSGHGNELWCYDGTNLPFEVDDINTGGDSFPSALTFYDDELYFSADGGSGRKLWHYNGTDSPEEITGADYSVTVLNIGVGDTNLIVYDGELYFNADGGTGNGKELWCYDGVNPYEADDINAGGDSNPSDFAIYNNDLYFSADGGSGRKLWHYNGTGSPDEITGADYYVVNGANLISCNGKLYFCGNGDNGNELWCYNGSNPPYEVFDLKTGASSGMEWPYEIAVFNDKLFFAGEGSDNGIELWCYNAAMPLEAGINPVELDIYTGTQDGWPLDFTVFNKSLYFLAACNGTDYYGYWIGYELWVCNY
jgi:ELWxxDGT repeat protein